MKYFFMLFLCSISSQAFSQKNGEALIDSLKKEILATSSDSGRVKNYLRISDVYIDLDLSKSLFYADSAASLAEKIKWDSKTGKWLLKNYMQRTNREMKETLVTGRDTLMSYKFLPKDFEKKVNEVYTMNARELDEVISELTSRGADNIAFYEVEKYKRTSFPFAIFILTLIGVSLASRKVRGGIGLHIGIGIAISFAYLLFQQFSQTFSTNGDLPAVIGVWIPNFIFGMVAVYLYLKAPK